ncbi:hypothetical protein GQX74_004516 [Glossina fuscipes]|nr:hypothetical protein GQX74_004516 [Glossina fuscipes]
MPQQVLFYEDGHGFGAQQACGSSSVVYDRCIGDALTGHKRDFCKKHFTEGDENQYDLQIHLQYIIVNLHLRKLLYCSTLQYSVFCIENHGTTVYYSIVYFVLEYIVLQYSVFCTRKYYTTV